MQPFYIYYIKNMLEKPKLNQMDLSEIKNLLVKKIKSKKNKTKNTSINKKYMIV